jgi:hypothetical protein
LLEEPPDVRTVADAPEELATIIARCLKKDPASRPTAEDVARTLTALRDGLAGTEADRRVLPTIST